MKLFWLILLLCRLTSATEAEKCHVIKMADIGWTDVTATTAVAKELLEERGYKPEILILSTPVTLKGLKNGDVDVFLGNWMPTQEADIRSYLQEKSIVPIHKNLTGAVFTLAVPEYTYAAGLRSFHDLKKFAHALDDKIYGIEPGNDGNRLILAMIKDKAFGLEHFKLVESSEQGMLVEVNDAIKAQRPIVFLGWAPHPMNLTHKLKYLTGGEKYFGNNLGASDVFTVARRDFAKDCPNLLKFFQNLTFTVDMENVIMTSILVDQLSPTEAAKKWLDDNKDAKARYIQDVNFYEHKTPTHTKAESVVDKLSLKHAIDASVTHITSFAPAVRRFSDHIEESVNSFTKSIITLPWWIIVTLLSALAYLYHRSIKIVVGIIVGMVIIVNLHLYEETMRTLVLVMLSSLLSISLGLPLGVIAAQRPWFYRSLRPILDLMQTLPTFVYLIPTLMLFGLGIVPGLVSTIIFALPAPIRLTYLGLKQVPKDLIEASYAFGASKTQTLMKVELPHAAASIMTGFSQCIMLSLSMVVIAALVGADGLGVPVVRALNTVNLAMGFEAGLAIVIVAILLDRSFCPRKHSVDSE